MRDNGPGGDDMMQGGNKIFSWPQKREEKQFIDAIEARLANLPLMSGDRKHLERCMARMDAATVDDWLRHYAATWRSAAEAERNPERKQNAGRRAANLLLLELLLERSEGR